MSDFEADTENDGTVHITPPYPEATGWRIKCADIGNAEYCAAKLNSLFAQLRADIARVTGERDRLMKEAVWTIETFDAAAQNNSYDENKWADFEEDGGVDRLREATRPTPPTGG